MKAGAHAFLGWLARGTQEMFDPLHPAVPRPYSQATVHAITCDREFSHYQQQAKRCSPCPMEAGSLFSSNPGPLIFKKCVLSIMGNLSIGDAAPIVQIGDRGKRGRDTLTTVPRRSRWAARATSSASITRRRKRTPPSVSPYWLHWNANCVAATRRWWATPTIACFLGNRGQGPLRHRSRQGRRGCPVRWHASPAAHQHQSSTAARRCCATSSSHGYRADLPHRQASARHATNLPQARRDHSQPWR